MKLSRPTETLARALLIAAVTLAAYLSSFDGAFYFDDAANILDTTHFDQLSLDSIRHALADAPNRDRPVANLTLQLDYYAHQRDVFGYHVVNVALHIGCALLVFAVFARLLRHRFEHREASWLALCGALLWAVHPVQPQTVTYVVQRMTVMATLFFLAGAYAFLRQRDAAGPARWAWTALLAAAYPLGILSKQIAVVLPVVLIAYALLFRPDDRRRLRVELAVLGALLVLGFLLTVDVGGGTGAVKSIVTTGYERRSFGLAERLMTQPRVIWSYLGLAVLPTPDRIMLHHHVAHSTGLLTPATTLPAIAGLLLILLAGALCLRRHKLAAMFLAWAVITTLLESSVLALELMYEHRMYLPLPGIIFFLLYWVWWIVRRRSPAWSRGAAAAGALAVAVLAAMSYQRNALYADRVAFLEDNARKTPGKASVFNNLGHAYLERGMSADAVVAFEHAVDLDPDEISAAVSLANAYVGVHRDAEALALLERFRDRPMLPAGYFHAYGKLLYFRGDRARARQLLERALEVNPQFPDANLGIAVIDIETGRFARAEQHLEREHAITGDGAQYHFFQGVIAETARAPAAALEHYRRAIDAPGRDDYRAKARARIEQLAAGPPDPQSGR